MGEIVKRAGVTIPLPGHLHSHKDRLHQLADAGYTDLWSAESDGSDGFTPLALAAAWEPRLRLGTAIIPAYTRGPACMAQSVASMADAAPGRFEKIVKEYDTFKVNGFRLGVRPEVKPEILVAGLREGMLKMAGRESDGAIINWLSPDDVRKVVAAVHEGSGGEPREIVARLFVCPSENAEVVREAAKFLIAAYLNVEVYAKFHEWLGRGPRLQGMWDAWQAGDRKAALAAIPDSVVDELVVHGSLAKCRETIERYYANGVTTTSLTIVPLDPAISYWDSIIGLSPSAS